MKCQYDGDCIKDAKYALYQLNDNFTKTWVNLCSKHDKEIANNNEAFKKLFPEVIWKEVK